MQWQALYVSSIGFLFNPFQPTKDLNMSVLRNIFSCIQTPPTKDPDQTAGLQSTSNQGSKQNKQCALSKPLAPLAVCTCAGETSHSKLPSAGEWSPSRFQAGGGQIAEREDDILVYDNTITGDPSRVGIAEGNRAGGIVRGQITGNRVIR